jgi:hypothetical protein
MRRLRRATIFAAVLAVAATALTGSADAGTATSLTLGVGTSYQYTVTRKYMAPDLGRVSKAGVRQVREDVYWHYVQPAANTWDWQRYDDLFLEAAAQGVEVLPILGYGVAWATGTTNMHELPNTDGERKAFATYAAAVVSRYGPNGAFWTARPYLEARPVRAVEVWNEAWFPGPPKPADYAALLRVTSAAVRTAVPGTKIVANVDDRVRWLGPGRTIHWAPAVLDADPNLGRWVDVWSIHPYPRDGRPSSVSQPEDALAQVRFLRDQLAARRLPGEVWITEIAFRNRPVTTEPTNSEATAKANLLTMLKSLQPLAAVARNPVTRVYLFTMARQDQSGVAAGTSGYGYHLVRADGSFTPALSAFCGLATQTLTLGR